MFTRKQKLQIRLRDRRAYRKSHFCELSVLGGVYILTDTELHHADGITKKFNPDRIFELDTNSHKLIHWALTED